MIQRNFTRPLTAWASLVALVCALCVAVPAHAQGGKLDPEILQAPQLTPDQKKLVASYVEANSKNLTGKAEVIKKDRGALLEPLLGSQPATAFRVEYSALLDPVLTPLVKNDNEFVVINALVIAAELATQKSVDLLKSAAASPKPAVRYQAAYGLRRTFRALAAMQSPTMQPDQIEKAIDFIGTRLGTEADALVVDGLILAGLEGATLPNHRARALAMIGKEVAARCKTFTPADSSDAMLDAMLRAGSGVRDTLTGVRAGQIDQTTLESSARLGGQLVAYCVRVVEAKAIPAANKEKREKLAQIAGAGETVALLAVQLQAGKAPEAKRFGEKLKTADAQFLVDAKDFLGAGGPLAGEPFKIPAGEFPIR